MRSTRMGPRVILAAMDLDLDLLEALALSADRPAALAALLSEWGGEVRAL